MTTQNPVERYDGGISTTAVGISAGPAGSKLAPANLAEVVKFAQLMSEGGVAIPGHLRGQAGACMAITIQAMEWEMSPFAVASKSYVVNDKIAYEAQLIAAVVNTRSGIKGRLRYRYEGEGDDLVCFCEGDIDGETLPYESPPKGTIHPQNSPLWKTDPRQQLGYYSARAWARRHTPEVLLGVYDREEAQNFHGPDQAKDVTPEKPKLNDRVNAQSNADAAAPREGFSAGFVAGQLNLDQSDQPAEEPSPSIPQGTVEESEAGDAPSTQAADEARGGDQGAHASGNTGTSGVPVQKQEVLKAKVPALTTDMTNEQKAALRAFAAAYYMGVSADERAGIKQDNFTALEKAGDVVLEASNKICRMIDGRAPEDAAAALGITLDELKAIK
ncbi:MAG: recombinase RecT [Pseudomonadota bacterium]